MVECGRALTVDRSVPVAETTSGRRERTLRSAQSRPPLRGAIRGWWSTVVRAKTGVLAAVVCRSDDGRRRGRRWRLGRYRARAESRGRRRGLEHKGPWRRLQLGLETGADEGRRRVQRCKARRVTPHVHASHPAALSLTRLTPRLAFRSAHTLEVLVRAFRASSLQGLTYSFLEACIALMREISTGTYATAAASLLPNPPLL